MFVAGRGERDGDFNLVQSTKFGGEGRLETENEIWPLGFILGLLGWAILIGVCYQKRGSAFKAQYLKSLVLSPFVSVGFVCVVPFNLAQLRLLHSATAEISLFDSTKFRAQPYAVKTKMALRVATLKWASSRTGCTLGCLRRWAHAIALPPPPLGTTNHTSSSLGFPEHQYRNEIEDVFPNWSFLGGSMELMAVPKRKVSPHKRGIRNGPKALKPVPVIIRCKVCGRVKLPHFFCCSGIKPNPSEHTG